MGIAGVVRGWPAVWVQKGRVQGRSSAAAYLHPSHHLNSWILPSGAPKLVVLPGLTSSHRKCKRSSFDRSIPAKKSSKREARLQQLGLVRTDAHLSSVGSKTYKPTEYGVAGYAGYLSGQLPCHEFCLTGGDWPGNTTLSQSCGKGPTHVGVTPVNTKLHRVNLPLNSGSSSRPQADMRLCHHNERTPG